MHAIGPATPKPMTHAIHCPPTVQIVDPDSPGGYVIINAADFNADTMTRFGESVAPLPPVPDLAAHLATLDADGVAALQARDTRKSAAPLYAARLADLGK